MALRWDPTRVDAVLVIVANLVNLLVATLLVSRAYGLLRIERGLGLAVVALALPLGIGAAWHAARGSAWWRVGLPLVLVAYLIAELLLDYVLGIDFRRTWLLGPYLLLYYLGLMSMIGYAFLVERAWGYVTLATYFVNLLATWYSYSRVGHG